MENMEHFGSLTERMRTFREEVLDEKPYIDAERAVLATQAYEENQNQPRVMMRALMLKKILENMSMADNKGKPFNTLAAKLYPLTLSYLALASKKPLHLKPT